jgi:plasmid replication initiation protein
MQTIQVHFYNPALDKDGLVNKLVAYADPPYCHCELEFENGQSCAIYMGGKTHIKTRKFDPQSYDTVAVTCAPDKHAKALQLAQTLAAEGQTFSKRAMLASKFARMPVPDPRAYTFCSKLCGELLQQAGVLRADLNVARLTPSGLHKAIIECHPVVCDTTVIDFRLL